MDMKRILQAIDGASAKKPAEGSNDMKKFLQIVEGKGSSNRLTQAESIAVQTYTAPEPRKTITSPVLNVSKDARPSMAGKYFKKIEEEFQESQQRYKDRATTLAERVAKKVMERVVPGQETPPGINRLTGKPNEPAAATPDPVAPAAPMPGKDLPKAERADRQAGTVTVDGQDYKMVMLEPGGLRPRGGQRIAIPQAVMGERGIGNYIGILAGSTVYVLPRGEQESVQEETEGVDSVTLDVPLLIRLMEFAREDAQDDMTLHQIAERMVGMKEEGQSLSMSDYEDIVGGDKLDEACWKTHKQIGMKKKGKRMVPNCVPK